MFIKRKVKMFFVTYGKSLLLFCGLIVLFLMGLKFINSLYVYKTKDDTKNQIENSKSFYEIKENQMQYSKDIKIVEEFIEYCINGEYDKAYSMLSDDCKVEKYQTIDIFINNYIKEIYSIQIVSYTYKIKDNSYIYYLKQNALSVGKDNIYIEQLFFVVNKNKIYIGK